MASFKLGGFYAFLTSDSVRMNTIRVNQRRNRASFMRFIHELSESVIFRSRSGSDVATRFSEVWTWSEHLGGRSFLKMNITRATLGMGRCYLFRSAFLADVHYAYGSA